MTTPRKKSAMFTARIAPETRAALEAASQASGKSLSQEIEERLQESLAGSSLGLDKQPDHVQALAALVVMLTEKIEAASGLSWRRDELVCEAIIDGIQVMLLALGPMGPQMPRKAPNLRRSWLKQKQIIPDPPSNRAPATSWAKHFGAVTAAGLVCHLPTAIPEAVPPSLSDADVARLVWIREKLATETPPDPREWSELVRLAQEELEVPTEPKDEEKKS
jgi:hypothetical protein